MPPPTLAQDRLARAQHPNQQSSYTTAVSARGRGGPTASTTSGPVSRGNAAPAANTRGGRASDTSGTNGRSANSQGERLPGNEARGAHSNEMWEDRQRRQKAATVLGSWELLAWYAVAGNEVRLLTLLHGLCCSDLEIFHIPHTKMLYAVLA